MKLPKLNCHGINPIELKEESSDYHRIRKEIDIEVKRIEHNMTPNRWAESLQSVHYHKVNPNIKVGDRATFDRWWNSLTQEERRAIYKKHSPHFGIAEVAASLMRPLDIDAVIQYTKRKKTADEPRAYAKKKAQIELETKKALWRY